MENCRERDAAQKLADWYGVGDPVTTPKNGNGQKSATKTAPLGEERSGVEVLTDNPHNRSLDRTSPDRAVKYMEGIDGWFDKLFELTDDMKTDEFWKRVRNGVKSKLIESYKNGKAAATVSR
jgi:hypothetical protein